MSQNEHCQDSGEYFSGVYLENLGNSACVPINEPQAEPLVHSPLLGWLAPTCPKAVWLAE